MTGSEASWVGCFPYIVGLLAQGKSDWGREMPALLEKSREMSGLLESWPLLKLPLEPHSPFLCHTGHARAFFQGTQVPGPLDRSTGSGALCGV